VIKFCVTVIWIVAQCSVAVGYQRFAGTRCLHLLRVILPHHYTASQHRRKWLVPAPLPAPKCPHTFKVYFSFKWSTSVNTRPILSQQQ